jgi:beta-phosphoglucomutase-like phosphatase (HAD superfamily)
VRARAVIFDFNGTLSNDEALLCEIFAELFAEQGRPMTARQYFDELAGLADAEIVERWLGADHPHLGAVIEQRIARYRARAGDGSTVSEQVREAVRYAAGRVPVGVVSGAARAEIEPVLRAAGLAHSVAFVIAAEDVSAGKPDPAGYLKALASLGGDVPARKVVALEDSEAGVASARAAGLRCVAVMGTLSPERLRAADAVVPEIDLELMRSLVGA